ncbi:MAG: tyrosine-type recombinase/integrase [Desulfohalobiaceae bacterium]
MPKVTITPNFVASPPACPAGRLKVDYFDSQIPGFLLEVRATGRCTFYQRYRDRFGRIKQSRIGPTDSVSLEDARQQARQIRSQTSMGFDPRAEVERSRNMPTFRQFVEDKYLPFIQVQKRSWRQDEKMLNNRILPVWGKMILSEISREEVQELQANFVRVGYKPASVNRYMALIKFVFSLAEKWEVIDKSPARGVSRLEENNKKERYLSQEETQRLLAAIKTCQSPVVPDLIEFLILTGARRSEAMQAMWPDVDLVRNIWTIPLSKSGKARHVPLSRAALQVLDRRKDNGTQYIFPNPATGLPLKHFHNTWDRIRRKAGIPDVRIHDLRHNFASLLINSGRSLYEVQKLLGHADISTTQRYAHLAQDTLRDAAELVSSSIASESNNEGLKG